jgi:hypothetical protein
MDFWAGLMVRGRCNTQTLFCESTDTLDTSPNIHLLGIFGQDGSTSKMGTFFARALEACAAQGVVIHATNVVSKIKNVCCAIPRHFKAFMLAPLFSNLENNKRVSD